MEALPSLAMVAVECSNVVINILFKAASFKGLNYYTFVTYCFVLGTLVFIPVIYFRKIEFPPLNFPVISRLCLLGLTGCLTKTFSAKGVELSSPTLSSAVASLLPAFTFILAVFFRMEKVEFRRSSTKAKIIGTIASITGALVMTFYKGPQIISSSTRTSLSSSSSSVLEFQRPLGSSESNWIIGGILEAVAYLILSFWCIIEAQVLNMYPEEIAVNLFYNLSAAIVSLPISLVAEPDLTSWRLTSGVSVVAVLYSGLFGFSFSSAVHTWCIHRKGPVFVASFRPTSIVIAAVMSAIFLGEAVHLGSVIGAVIVTVGLYAVLWGKAKEEERRDGEYHVLSRLGPLSSDQAPLLQSYKS